MKQRNLQQPQNNSIPLQQLSEQGDRKISKALEYLNSIVNIPYIKDIYIIYIYYIYIYTHTTPNDIKI